MKQSLRYGWLVLSLCVGLFMLLALKITFAAPTQDAAPVSKPTPTAAHTAAPAAARVPTKEFLSMDYPLLVFVISFTLMVLSTRIGDALRRRASVLKESGRADTGLLFGAILTLLFLIIGFTYSLAINRYDLRKNCEQAEAIAIGMEYSRADLLAPADAAKVQALLKRYLDKRILFYTTRSQSRLSEISADILRLQRELWSTIRPAIANVPAPLMGVLVSGMNEVTNSQISSQAAWLNRIPVAAWALIAIISSGSCWLIGYRARRTDWLAFLVVPVAVSVSLFLIADLDSPRDGAIRVTPQNLLILSESLVM